MGEEPLFDSRIHVRCAECGRVLYRMTDDPDVIHRCARCAAIREPARGS
jgi:phage FluMu protein Com